MIDSGSVKTIIDHKNYNPRVIEAMTDILHVKGIAPCDYSGEFVRMLNNPRDLWDKPIRSHILPKCRHLLFVIFFCSEYGGTNISELRPTYNALHARLCTKYGIAFDHKDFEEAIRILEGGFIEIKKRDVSFINPSLRD